MPKQVGEDHAFDVLSRQCSSFCMDDDSDREKCAKILARHFGSKWESFYVYLDSELAGCCFDSETDCRKAVHVFNRAGLFSPFVRGLKYEK